MTSASFPELFRQLRQPLGHSVRYITEVKIIEWEPNNVWFLRIKMNQFFIFDPQSADWGTNHLSLLFYSWYK